MFAVCERADCVLGDVGREQEEGDRDESLCALLGALGQPAGAGEAPDNDDRREALDRGVEAEPEQRDGAGEDCRGDRDRALSGHVGEAEPGQRLRAADQPVALGRLEHALLLRSGGRRGESGKFERRGAHCLISANSRCASSSRRPGSVRA